MPEKNDYIIIADRVMTLPCDTKVEYLAHLLCIGGSCRYRYNDRDFEIGKGDVSIIRKRNLIENVEISDDFRCKIIYVHPGFIELCTPQSNYGVKGALALFLDPVIHLTPDQFAVCRRDYEILEERIIEKNHMFWKETVINAMQAAILDFYDFQARIHGESEITTQQASIMTRFLELLESGAYRQHRKVTYYADKLCVTPKYLSEIAKKVSGNAANYWINRYTVLEITRLLRAKSYSLVEISDMLGFSSQAYFSRYVQQYLGMRPSDYRE